MHVANSYRSPEPLSLWLWNPLMLFFCIGIAQSVASTETRQSLPTSFFFRLAQTICRREQHDMRHNVNVCCVRVPAVLSKALLKERCVMRGPGGWLLGRHREGKHKIMGCLDIRSFPGRSKGLVLFLATFHYRYLKKGGSRIVWNTPYILDVAKPINELPRGELETKAKVGVDVQILRLESGSIKEYRKNVNILTIECQWHVNVLTMTIYS